MNINHYVTIRQRDAVSTLQKFLTAWWTDIGLDAMLAPVEMAGQTEVLPRVIENVDQVSTVNPFAPLMLTNTAALVNEFVEQFPGKRLAVMLRPCELRTMIELDKRHMAPAYSRARNQVGEGPILIGVDCPGTFKAGDYAARLEKLGMAKMVCHNLTHGTETTLSDQEFRLACQLCDQPLPLGADLMIGAICAEETGVMLVIARNEELDTCLDLAQVTDGFASEEQVVLHEEFVGGIANHRLAKRQQYFGSGSLYDDFGSILATFALCTLCADCLDACPIYYGELAGMLGVQKYQDDGRAFLPELVKVSRWMASCSGCGMCQDACEHGVTLGRLIAGYSHRIRAEMNYRAGNPDQRLPWEAV